jgi:hypothetical protein
MAYKFTIQHQKGKYHTNADALSRASIIFIEIDLLHHQLGQKAIRYFFENSRGRRNWEI